MTKHHLKDAAEYLASKGRYGDTMLVHMNPEELKWLAAKSPTGKLTINPDTGQPEAFLPFLAPLIGGLAGGAFASAVPALGLTATMGAALGSGLGSFAATGDITKGITSGLLGYGLGSAADLLASGAEGIAGAGTEAAKEAAKNAAATTATPSAIPGSAAGVDNQIAQAAQGASTGLNVANPTTGYANDQIASIIEKNALPGHQAAQNAASMMNPLEKYSAAAQNITNPDVLKNTFWTNAMKTTVPIGAGLYGMYGMDSGTGQQAPQPYQPYYPYPSNQGTGRKYQYQAPDPYGRERTYFTAAEGGGVPGYQKGGEVERYKDRPRDYEDRPRYRDRRDSYKTTPRYRPLMQDYRDDYTYERDDKYDFVLRDKQPEYLYEDGRRGMPPGQGSTGLTVDQAEKLLRQYEEQRSKLPPYGDMTSPSPFDRGALPPIQRFARGGYIGGPGGGLDDAIPAVIDGRQPAKLSSGEYVVPAHAVSALGNGSTEHGVRELDKMVDRTMQGKYGTKNRKPRPIKADKMMAGLGAMRGKKGAGKKANGPFEYQSGGVVDRVMRGLGLRADEPPQDPGRSWNMDVPKTEWPTQEDVEAARAYKERWGNPNEWDIKSPRVMYPDNENVRYNAPGSPLNLMSYEGSKIMYDTDGKKVPSKKGQSAELADRLYAAQMAAQADPVAYLGMDPNRFYITNPPEQTTVNGRYYPPEDGDRIWWNGYRHTTPAHESMHRGLEIMRQSDPAALKQPAFGGAQEPYDEEKLVRRMMMSRYGDVEVGKHPALIAAREKHPEMEKYIKGVRKKAHEMVAKEVIKREGGVK